MLPKVLVNKPGPPGSPRSRQRVPPQVTSPQVAEGEAREAELKPPRLVLQPEAQPGLQLQPVELTPGQPVALGRLKHGVPDTKGTFGKLSREHCTVEMGGEPPWRVVVAHGAKGSTRVGSAEVGHNEKRKCKPGDLIVIGGMTVARDLVTYRLLLS